MQVEEIKGVGEKTKDLLNKVGIFNSTDLIEYIPRTYDTFKKPILIDEIDDEKIVAIIGKFSKKLVPINAGKKRIVSGIFFDEAGKKIQTVWYNMPFLAKTVFTDTVYILRGTIKRDRYGNVEKMLQPQIFSVDDYMSKLNSLWPVYSLTKGLTNNALVKYIKEVFESELASFDIDFLPENIRNGKGLSTLYDAYNNIHFPKTEQDVINARKRLCFDEFLMFIMALRSLKNKGEVLKSEFTITPSKITLDCLSKLPYELTDAQKNVLSDIQKDLSSGNVMNRLIQGDVGSGKTVIGQLTLMDTVFSGYQGAMMAPTEVLAKQHYDNFVETFKKNNLNINVVLLTGSMSAKEKGIAYEKIAEGSADIIIGTHALIVDKLQYNNLALVITDEQHRFGVMQRKHFSQKGSLPHILVMSATPIPRTLAIILYGDLDISVIDQLPTNRLPIKNCVVPTSYRKQAYAFMKKQIKEGHQIYIICPMVEASENIEACDVISYTKDIKEIFDENTRIEMLHGKMKPSEKNRIMEEFSKGNIDILVSTTVIEVGVNVPNATVMMVESAERFGLASLHQLRGRIGRGNAQSYCIFVSGSKNKDKMNRLNILNQSNDGFFIASEDLKLRGPGDLFGIKQSGEALFKIGDVYGDMDMLKEAFEFSNEIEGNSSLLPQKNRELLFSRINKYIKTVFDTVNL